MQWKIRDLVRTHLLPMEHNATDNDHDEHQKHRKKATSDELHAVFSEFPTVRLWISSPPNFLGQCDDVWVPSFTCPSHGVAKTPGIPIKLVGGFGFENPPGQILYLLPQLFQN